MRQKKRQFRTNEISKHNLRGTRPSRLRSQCQPKCTNLPERVASISSHILLNYSATTWQSNDILTVQPDLHIKLCLTPASTTVSKCLSTRHDRQKASLPHIPEQGSFNTLQQMPIRNISWQLAPCHPACTTARNCNTTIPDSIRTGIPLPTTASTHLHSNTTCYNNQSYIPQQTTSQSQQIYNQRLNCISIQISNSRKPTLEKKNSVLSMTKIEGCTKRNSQPSRPHKTSRSQALPGRSA